MTDVMAGWSQTCGALQLLGSTVRMGCIVRGRCFKHSSAMLVGAMQATGIPSVEARKYGCMARDSSSSA
jgi:hypothetical protein